LAAAERIKPQQGQSFIMKGITIRIVEVAEWRMPWGERYYLVGYRIVDGDRISPVAHILVRDDEDLRPWLEKIADYYNQVKQLLTVR